MVVDVVGSNMEVRVFGVGVVVLVIGNVVLEVIVVVEVETGPLLLEVSVVVIEVGDEVVEDIVEVGVEARSKGCVLCVCNVEVHVVE